MAGKVGFRLLTEGWTNDDQTSMLVPLGMESKLYSNGTVCRWSFYWVTGITEAWAAPKACRCPRFTVLWCRSPAVPASAGVVQPHHDPCCDKLFQRCSDRTILGFPLISITQHRTPLQAGSTPRLLSVGHFLQAFEVHGRPQALQLALGTGDLTSDWKRLTRKSCTTFGQQYWPRMG